MKEKNLSLFAIGIVVLVGFLLTSISSYFASQTHTIESLIKTELPLTRDNIFSEVQRDLLAPQIVSSVMSDDTFLKDWMTNPVKDIPAITSYLSEIAKKYDAFTAFLVVNETLNYYNEAGFLKTVDKNDSRDKWFFRFRKCQYRIQLNTDPSEAHNDEMTTFINVRVLGDNDAFIGAVGLGLKIDSLRGMLESYHETYGSDVYFITQEGNVLLHEDKQMEGVNIHQLEGLSSIANDVLSSEYGEYRYESEDGEVLLNTRYVKDLHLTLAVAANIEAVTNKNLQSLLSNLAISALISAIVGFLLYKAIKSNQSKLKRLAWWDELTGIYNRQAFVKHYDDVFKKSQSSGWPLALMLIDIDHFKSINDQLGHIVGDKVLKAFAQTLMGEMSKEMLLARWGGEEFVLVFPVTDEVDPKLVYQHLADAVEGCEEIAKHIDNQLTFSAGCILCDSAKDIFANFDVADKLLYQAKDLGRNKIVMQSDDATL